MSIDKPNKYMMMLGHDLPVVNHTSNVTTVKDGKRVVPKGERKQEQKTKADRAPSTRIVRKGYVIEKERERNNGVTRPSEGTVCGAVWKAFDEILLAAGVVLASQLPELADRHNWNRTNVSCEFYAWRKFKGIKGRSIKKEGV